MIMEIKDIVECVLKYTRISLKLLQRIVPSSSTVVYTHDQRVQGHSTILAQKYLLHAENK